MLAPYRRVFAHPGAAAFSATGLLARLPISMMTLGIVLLASQVTGSYALAGQLAAAYVVGNAAFAVVHGRLADRFGQGLVLRVDTVVFGLSASVMVVAISEGWATPLPHLLAVLAGMSIPQIGSLVRARWAHLMRGPERDDERHTAFAVEGVVDEVIFVTGPVLVTLLATAVLPEAGLAVAIVAGTLGSLLLAAQRRTEPPRHRPVAGDRRAPMPWRLLLPVTLGALALGSLFGAVEVATVALAEGEGRPALAGPMLGVFALGSLIAGLWAGARSFAVGPLTRIRVGVGVLGAGTLALPFLPGLALVSVCLFLAGLAVAPTLIAIFSLIEAAVPGSRLNEALGFVHTGVAAGIAPGTWGAGVVADTAGASAAYGVCVASALLAAVACVLTRTPSARERHPTPAVPA